MRPQKFLLTTQSYRHEYETGVEIPTPFGYLVETDFDSFQRVLIIPTPVDSPHGERIKPGLRGLCFLDGKLYVASWNAVHVVDYDTFEVLETFSHPLMSDVHGILVDARHICITSTLIDALLIFDRSRNLEQVLQLSPTALYPQELRAEVDLDQDYRLRGKPEVAFSSFHINHVAILDDEKLLVTGRGARWQTGRVLLVDRRSLAFDIWLAELYGPHDGQFIEPGLFALTETNEDSVAVFKVDGRKPPELLRRIYLPRSVDRFWTRGLAVATNHDLLIGRSAWKGEDRKAIVLRVNLQGEVSAHYELDLPDYPECRIFQILASPAREG
jgi:hypothetical protein